MTADTARLFATYAIAVVVIIGLFVLLLIPTPEIPPEAKLAIVTTNFGLVLGWVFNRESTAGGQRSAERAVSLGASTTAAATAAAGPTPTP